MKDQIDPRIKKERTAVLLDLSKELWDKYTDRFIDKDVEILIEKVDKAENSSTGHTNNYIDVKIAEKCYKPGDIITVKLQKSMIISK